MNYDDIIQNVTNWDEFPIPVDLSGMELSLIGGIAYKTIISRVKFCVKIAKIQNSNVQCAIKICCCIN